MKNKMKPNLSDKLSLFIEKNAEIILAVIGVAWLILFGGALYAAVHFLLKFW